MPLILILLSVIIQIKQSQPAVIRRYQYFIALPNKPDPGHSPPRRKLASPIFTVNPSGIVETPQIITSVEGALASGKANYQFPT